MLDRWSVERDGLVDASTNDNMLDDDISQSITLRKYFGVRLKAEDIIIIIIIIAIFFRPSAQSL